MFIIEKLFEIGIECKDMKDYVNQSCITCMVDSMVKQYNNYSDKEKLILEYRLKDIINDCESGDLGNIVAIGLAIFAAIITKNLLYLGICSLIILYIYMQYTVLSIKYVRRCKLFLNVIENIKLEKNKQS